MKIEVGVQSYNTHGGVPSVSPVGDFLSLYLRDLEPASLAIEVTVCFRTGGPPLPTLEQMYEDFHRLLEAPASVRYSPAKNRLEIRYASRALLAEEAMAFGEPSLHVFTTMFHEIAGVISSVLESHKKLRGAVSLPAARAAIEAATASLPRSASGLHELVQEEGRRAAAERAGRSPWEQLQIDWSDYHASARDCLDDPFFWDDVDECAPHGNDTGADILQLFREWRKRNRSVPVARFLPLQIRRWGFEPQVRAWTRKASSEWSTDDESVMSLYDEAAIAVAFAQIKYEATCDPELAETALQSISRQLDPGVHAHFGWSVPVERLQRLREMQSVLSARKAST